MQGIKKCAKKKKGKWNIKYLRHMTRFMNGGLVRNPKRGIL